MMAPAPADTTCPEENPGPGEGVARGRINSGASTPPALASQAGGAATASAVTAASLTARLEEAGATLLALPVGGRRPTLRASRWPRVHAAVDAYGWSGARLRPALPAASAISRMDEALGWISLIPEENYVLRRIVGARSLVSPLSGRHLFSWRRLGSLLGADARAVKRWHAKGVGLIVNALNQSVGG